MMWAYSTMLPNPHGAEARLDKGLCSMYGWQTKLEGRNVYVDVMRPHRS